MIIPKKTTTKAELVIANLGKKYTIEPAKSKLREDEWKRLVHKFMYYYSSFASIMQYEKTSPKSRYCPCLWYLWCFCLFWLCLCILIAIHVLLKLVVFLIANPTRRHIKLISINKCCIVDSFGIAYSMRRFKELISIGERWMIDSFPFIKLKFLLLGMHLRTKQPQGFISTWKRKELTACWTLHPAASRIWKGKGFA